MAVGCVGSAEASGCVVCSAAPSMLATSPSSSHSPVAPTAAAPLPPTQPPSMWSHRPSVEATVPRPAEDATAAVDSGVGRLGDRHSGGQAGQRSAAVTSLKPGEEQRPRRGPALGQSVERVVAATIGRLSAVYDGTVLLIFRSAAASVKWLYGHSRPGHADQTSGGQ